MKRQVRERMKKIVYELMNELVKEQAKKYYLND